MMADRIVVEGIAAAFERCQDRHGHFFRP